jgi:indole-3-glycerol phosphate synthase
MKGRDILAEILAVKQIEVAEARARRSLAALEQACADAGDMPRGFREKLARGAGDEVRVIAEIKRASPSAGPIRMDAEPEEIARAYEQAGAAAISVLTDQRFFAGELCFLTRARGAVALPILRKDFLIDVYQVIEARAAGADAVLLIAAALSQDRLIELLAAAHAWGMDALVEVHSAHEARRALAAGANLIGINHRDLSSFAIDMSLSARLAAEIPDGVVLVGESGIRSAEDVRALGQAGADAVLVGERLMRAPSQGAALAELLARRVDRGG